MTAFEMIEANGLTLHGDIEHFAELVRADEAEKYKWNIHSCGPAWMRYACVSMRKAVEAEREACALIAEIAISGEQDDITMEAKDRVATAIRARGDKHEQ